MRYDFLRRICRAVGAARVCTAHTADDQSETVMMRLLSGIEGTLIAGIPRTRDLGCGVTVERPLLDFRRQQIESYLEQRSASWSDDRTNVELRYRRNLVRRQVLPEVERFWPAVRSDLVALARAMAAYRERVEAEAAELRPTVTDDEALVDRDAFFTLSEDARLELLYSLLERLELFGRRDRPSHRFFAPLLGADPGVDRRLVGARGIDISLRGAELVVSARVVRSPESRYLR
jgi:tRNA(Ile)-lysidine synthase